MKIDSSSISMESGRFHAQTTHVKQQTQTSNLSTGVRSDMNRSFSGMYASYSGSFSSNTASDQYDSYIASTEGTDSDTVSGLYNNLSSPTVSLYDIRSSLEEFHQTLIDQLETFMERIRQQLLGYQGNGNTGILDLTTGNAPGTMWSLSDPIGSAQPVTGSYVTTQTKQTITMTETETTSFRGTGTVQTADGRAIDFNISLDMSRSFTQSVESISTNTQYILTDPLVIQLEDAPDTISDQKWFFDLDGDGKEEEISGLAKGNAFLALDRDGNGKIDNGSELFGTKTGNGFKELAEYDEDGNGWIDENDAIYSKLKIWVKDASGNDKLMDLQQADIGAIYLGSADTQFSHTNIESNAVNAVVRQTGFFLHESSGMAGTIQQIDFAS